MSTTEQQHNRKLANTNTHTHTQTHRENRRRCKNTAWVNGDITPTFTYPWRSNMTGRQYKQGSQYSEKQVQAFLNYFAELDLRLSKQNQTVYGCNMHIRQFFQQCVSSRTVMYKIYVIRRILSWTLGKRFKQSQGIWFLISFQGLLQGLEEFEKSMTSKYPWEPRRKQLHHTSKEDKANDVNARTKTTKFNTTA